MDVDEGHIREEREQERTATVTVPRNPTAVVTERKKTRRRTKFDDSHLTTTPPDEVLARCPVGNNHHRAWACPHTDDQRSRGVSDHIVAAALKMQGNDPLGDRGLYPVQIIPVPPSPRTIPLSGSSSLPTASSRAPSTRMARGSTARLRYWLSMAGPSLRWTRTAPSPPSPEASPRRGSPTSQGRKLGQSSKLPGGEPPTPLFASTASPASTPSTAA